MWKSEKLSVLEWFKKYVLMLDLVDKYPDKIKNHWMIVGLTLLSTIIFYLPTTYIPSRFGDGNNLNVITGKIASQKMVKSSYNLVINSNGKTVGAGSVAPCGDFSEYNISQYIGKEAVAWYQGNAIYQIKDARSEKLLISKCNIDNYVVRNKLALTYYLLSSLFVVFMTIWLFYQANVGFRTCFKTHVYYGFLTFYIFSTIIIFNMLGNIYFYSLFSIWR